MEQNMQGKKHKRPTKKVVIKGGLGYILDFILNVIRSYVRALSTGDTQLDLYILKDHSDCCVKNSLEKGGGGGTEIAKEDQVMGEV